MQCWSAVQERREVLVLVHCLLYGDSSTLLTSSLFWSSAAPAEAGGTKKRAIGGRQAEEGALTITVLYQSVRYCAVQYSCSTRTVGVRKEEGGKRHRTAHYCIVRVPCYAGGVRVELHSTVGVLCCVRPKSTALCKNTHSVACGLQPSRLPACPVRVVQAQYTLNGSSDWSTAPGQHGRGAEVILAVLPVLAALAVLASSGRGREEEGGARADGAG